MPFLDWVNKNHAVTASQAVPYHLLQLEKTFGDVQAAQDNLLIQGDNLQALKALLPFYTSKVKCIFIDPPYNTEQAFDHYDDKLEHSQWLTMMYPRLVLLRELLAEDGMLFCQIDDREFARLYMLFVEIFGAGYNSRNIKTICVKMSEASGLKMGSIKKIGGIAKLKEFVILTGKSGLSNINLEKIPKEKWDTEYNILLENFTKDDRAIIQNIYDQEDVSDSQITQLDNLISKVNLGSVAQELKRLGLTDKKAKDAWCFENAWRICQCAASLSVFELALEKQKINKHNIFFSKSKKGVLYMVRNPLETQSKKPRIQLIFADDNLMLHPGDFWSDIKTTGLDGEGTVEFKNSKKPEALVKRIISMCTNENDLILDSFLGSGTTAAVAHKMKRRYIGIEMGEHAKTHCIPRLQKVIEGEQGGISKAVNWQGGGGFSFYTLGDAVFDANGHISASVRFHALAAYIWLLETKTAIATQAHTPFIGEHEGVAYYLLYNGILGDRRPNGGNVLTNPILAHLNAVHPHAGKKIILGEASRIGDEKLASLGIVFKQIPYELHQRV